VWPEVVIEILPRFDINHGGAFGAKRIQLVTALEERERDYMQFQQIVQALETPNTLPVVLTFRYGGVSKWTILRRFHLWQYITGTLLVICFKFCFHCLISIVHRIIQK
jgi:hypothetical protein